MNSRCENSFCDICALDASKSTCTVCYAIKCVSILHLTVTFFSLTSISLNRNKSARTRSNDMIVARTKTIEMKAQDKVIHKHWVIWILNNSHCFNEYTHLMYESIAWYFWKNGPAYRCVGFQNRILFLIN